MLAVLAGLGAFISTISGGLFALRFRTHLQYILGFTAGVVFGVVIFDVIPEIFKIIGQIGISYEGPMIALVSGFLIFHLLEQLVASHHASEIEGPATHKIPAIGFVSAGGLIAHSFLDGVGIGLAFQAGVGLGLTITIAVIAHDFSDGLNTVSLMLRHGNRTRNAALMLAAGAAAPVLGVLATFLFNISATGLVLYLGFFAGFLLYISASSILPEVHKDKFSWPTFGLTVLGTVLMFYVSQSL
jgi:zinc transporter ZupT